jgi:protein-tyrosine-phosphatase
LAGALDCRSLYRRVPKEREVNDLQVPAEAPFTDLGPLPSDDWQAVVAKLSEEFSGIFSVGTIEQVFRDTLSGFGGARVTAFVPLLAQRQTRERLWAVARSTATNGPSTLQVLFVCTDANQALMVLSLFEQRVPGNHAAYSAFAPAPSEADAAVVEVLAERGVVPVSYKACSPARELVVQAMVVVTVGREDACPIVPGPRYVDWSLPTASGADRESLRRLRDSMDNKLEVLVAELSQARVTK